MLRLVAVTSCGADKDGAVSVVDDVVAHAAQDSAAKLAHTARASHNQCRLQRLGGLHNHFTRLAVHRLQLALDLVDKQTVTQRFFYNAYDPQLIRVSGLLEMDDANALCI